MKIIFYFLSFVLILNSCNFIKENISEDSAKDYNNRILLQNEILVDLFTKTLDKKLSAEESKVLTQNFLNACDNSLDTLSKMEAFFNDNSLKNGMIDYVKSFKLIVEKDRPKIDSVLYSNKELSDSQIDKTPQLLYEFYKKIDKVQDKLDKINLAFIKRYESSISN